MSRSHLEWHGEEVQAQLREAAEQGIGLAAEHLLAASRARVPIEEGTLERSGVASSQGLRAMVAYDTPYAVIQHEALEFRHDAGRTAKYLEGPADEERDALTDIVAAAIRRAT